MTALHSLEVAGETITFPAVARAAGVSTWLVYAKGVREHIEAARGRQAIKPTTAPQPRPLVYRPTSRWPEPR
jgi:hypothetical protein